MYRGRPSRIWKAVAHLNLPAAVMDEVVLSGSHLAEHENPGEARLQVLHGRVRLSSGEHSWEGRTWDLLIVPDGRHSLEVLEDPAVLLTVAKLP